MSKNILVIEDNLDIAHLIELHLKDLSFGVDLAADGELGLDQSQRKAYDLVILDLMLPKLDGLEVCKNIRKQSRYTPILMLTAKSSELDRVLGLEIGADDYVTKPFSILELVARVKAIFRRTEASKSASNDDGPLIIGDMTIDMAKRKVNIADRDIDLTAREFDLLEFFARHPGRVYSRTQLLDLVWGYGHDGYEHTVNSHINRLRAKIEEDPAQPKYILTVWGVGYKFNDEIA